MIIQLHRSKEHPKRLEHLTMKTVLRNGQSLNNLPKSLQMKAQHGFIFGEQSCIPENLTDEGCYWYEVLLTLFKIENVNFKYSLKRRED